jgi:hypothetical protein
LDPLPQAGADANVNICDELCADATYEAQVTPEIFDECMIAESLIEVRLVTP